MQVLDKLLALSLEISTLPNTLVNYLESCSKYKQGQRITSSMVEGISY